MSNLNEVQARPMIEAVGLGKFFGCFEAVRDVSFSVPQAQVTAFLGPNGAGKSTTMRLLTGYLTPSAGEARLAGFDVVRERIEVARRVGYLPENCPLYPEMTPLALLSFLGRARGLSGKRLRERLDAVIAQCALEPVIEKPARKLSRGYRQRVGVAQALLHDPEILILDEPTSGLDPNQIREARDLMRRLARNKTILLSTHILQEVEAVAERVILIHEGRIVFDGTPKEMTSEGETLEHAFHRLTSNDETGAREERPSSSASNDEAGEEARA
jgi:ABC-2 type transport system ATP-binding protein